MSTFPPPIHIKLVSQIAGKLLSGSKELNEILAMNHHDKVEAVREAVYLARIIVHEASVLGGE